MFVWFAKWVLENETNFQEWIELFSTIDYKHFVTDVVDILKENNKEYNDGTMHLQKGYPDPNKNCNTFSLLSKKPVPLYTLFCK